MHKAVASVVSALLLAGPLFSQASFHANVAVNALIPPGVVPRRAADFQDNVCIAVNAYPGQPMYANPDAVIALLTGAGIRHVRMGLLPKNNTDAAAQTMHNKIGAAGIKATLVVPNPSSSIAAADLVAAASQHTDAEALENPNEWDQANGYVVANWLPPLLAYMPKVYAAAHSLGLLAYGPALTSNGSYAALGNSRAVMDGNNQHDYIPGFAPETSGWGGSDNVSSHGYGSLEYDADYSNLIGPGIPVVMTEGGYEGQTPAIAHVTPYDVTGIYKMRLWLHAFNKGFARTCQYQLYDDTSTTRSTGPDSFVGSDGNTYHYATFGLLDENLVPRPAYFGIKNLLALVGDTKNSINPTRLNYTLTGGNRAGNHAPAETGRELVAGDLEPSSHVGPERKRGNHGCAANCDLVDHWARRSGCLSVRRNGLGNKPEQVGREHLRGRRERSVLSQGSVVLELL